MNFQTGRPDHIEDYLITVRTGQWFGWSDSKNKIYANLIVHDGGTKPSESDCTNGLKALQDAWDLENDSYKSKRRAEYPRTPVSSLLSFKLLCQDLMDQSILETTLRTFLI